MSVLINNGESAILEGQNVKSVHQEVDIVGAVESRLSACLGSLIGFLGQYQVDGIGIVVGSHYDKGNGLACRKLEGVRKSNLFTHVGLRLIPNACVELSVSRTENVCACFGCGKANDRLTPGFYVDGVVAQNKTVVVIAAFGITTVRFLLLYQRLSHHQTAIALELQTSVQTVGKENAASGAIGVGNGDAAVLAAYVIEGTGISAGIVIGNGQNAILENQNVKTVHQEVHVVSTVESLLSLTRNGAFAHAFGLGQYQLNAVSGEVIGKNHKGDRLSCLQGEGVRKNSFLGAVRAKLDHNPSIGLAISRAESIGSTVFR